VSQPVRLVIPSRVLREIGAVLGLVVLFLLAMFCQHWQEAREEVAEAVAETDQRDPGWRIEDLEAQRQLPAPEQNSALRVINVKSLLPPRWSRRPDGPKGELRGSAEDVLKNLEPVRQIDKQQAEQLRTDLEPARAALAQARELADMREGRFPVAWAADGISMQDPAWDPVRATACLLNLDAVLQNQDGRPDAALLAVRGLLNAGRSPGDEPFFGEHDRTWCRVLAADAVERTLAQGRPSQEALAATQEAVRQEDVVPLFLLHFRGHRAIMHLFLSRVDAGDNSISEISCCRTRGLNALIETWYGRPDAMRAHARYLRNINEAVEIAKLPLEEQYPQYRRWREQHGHVENVGHALSLGGRTEVYMLRGHAHLRCALVALAAERYRRQHAAWPRSLADLAPHYLKAVPLDPFDGKPLRYRRTDTGAVVYSIGEDAHDDGGDFNRPPNGGAPRDIVFTLWNVDQRRQLPKPPEQGDADRLR
jgi:hypothetical protein